MKYTGFNSFDVHKVMSDIRDLQIIFFVIRHGKSDDYLKLLDTCTVHSFNVNTLDVVFSPFFFSSSYYSIYIQYLHATLINEISYVLFYVKCIYIP